MNIKLDTKINHKPDSRILVEPRDIPALRNIHSWSRELCDNFDNKVALLQPRELLSNQDIEVFCNNYTFILSLAGDFDATERELNKATRYWREQYALTGDKQCLYKLLQPTVNKARLQRVKGDLNSFWSLINDLSLSDGAMVVIDGVPFEPSLFAEYRGFIEGVCFCETLKGLIVQKRYEEIISLEKSLPDYLICSTFYKEAKVFANLSLGRFSAANSTIKQVMRHTDQVEHEVFYYRLAESFSLQGENDTAACILSDIADSLAARTLDTLPTLIFAVCVVKRHGPRNCPNLVDATIRGFKKINDEMNLGQFILYLKNEGICFEEQEEEGYIQMLTESLYLPLRKMSAHFRPEGPPLSADKAIISLSERFDKIFS